MRLSEVLVVRTLDVQDGFFLDLLPVLGDVGELRLYVRPVLQWLLLVRPLVFSLVHLHALLLYLPLVLGVNVVYLHCLNIN